MRNAMNENQGVTPIKLTMETRTAAVLRRTMMLLVLFKATLPARAGMTVYDLNDVVRLRLEDISFFTVLLLLCALGIRFLWNFVAKDIPRWPRLTYGKALCLTGLISLLMLLVLSMISGARELLTPGAWRRQGSAYKLNDATSDPIRRRSIEDLRAVLFDYARVHTNAFPPHDFAPEIAEKIWQSPDSAGTRYIYFGGLNTSATNQILACEPHNFGNDRFALLTSGEILKLTTQEIHARVIGTNAPASKP